MTFAQNIAITKENEVPCTYDDSFERNEAAREAARVSALACMLLRASPLALHLLDENMFREAGITREWAKRWWAAHQQRDIERKEQERQDRERKKKRDAALAKLSPEDRDVLGIKTNDGG